MEQKEKIKRERYCHFHVEKSDKFPNGCRILVGECNPQECWRFITTTEFEKKQALAAKKSGVKKGGKV